VLENAGHPNGAEMLKPVFCFITPATPTSPGDLRKGGSPFPDQIPLKFRNPGKDNHDHLSDMGRRIRPRLPKNWHSND
jgi:hypothetical protein